MANCISDLALMAREAETNDEKMNAQVLKMKSIPEQIICINDRALTLTNRLTNLSKSFVHTDIMHQISKEAN